jgi:hypothetical protein
MCYDAVAMVVWGFFAIEAMSSATGGFGVPEGFPLTAWGDSISAVILGFVMILAAFFVASPRATTNNIGGVFGVTCSVLGAAVTIDWLVSLNATNFYNSNFTYAYAVLGPIAVIFAGFPLGLISSLMAFRSEAKSETLPTIGEVQTSPVA